MRDPKRRFDAIWRLCKPKMICDIDASPDDPEFEANPKEAAKRSHGGCGNVQPEVRQTALQLWGTWKVPKDEDNEGQQPEKKQITAEMALQVFRSIREE